MTIPATVRQLFLCAGCVSLSLGAAGPAPAVDAAVDLAGPDELKTAVTSGSLVMGAAAREDASAQDVVAAARADYANILGILYGQGYYGPVIHILVDGHEAADLSPFSVPASVGKVAISVDPGRQFTFGKAAVGPLAPKTVLPDGFATGKPAKAELIQQAVGDAVDGWREVGNAKAAAGARHIVAKHPAAVLDAEVAIVPGPVLRFGRLKVAGNKRVRTDRILEIAGLPYGKTFSPDRLDDMRRRLTQTGAFKSVAIEEAQQANPDGTLDITAALVEQPRRRLGFGAEVSSTEGLKLSAYWMHRNLLHGAENLRFDAVVSGIGGGSGGDPSGQFRHRLYARRALRPARHLLARQYADRDGGAGATGRAGLFRAPLPAGAGDRARAVQAGQGQRRGAIPVFRCRGRSGQAAVPVAAVPADRTARRPRQSAEREERLLC